MHRILMVRKLGEWRYDCSCGVSEADEQAHHALALAEHHAHHTHGEIVVMPVARVANVKVSSDYL